MNRYLPGNCLSSGESVLFDCCDPARFSVEVHDEKNELFGLREADFVGITALTGPLYSAYQIAQAYRKQGMPTVMGGIHLSMRTEEAVRFCDRKHNPLATRPRQHPLQFNYNTWVECPKGTH